MAQECLRMSWEVDECMSLPSAGRVVRRGRSGLHPPWTFPNPFSLKTCGRQSALAVIFWRSQGELRGRRERGSLVVAAERG